MIETFKRTPVAFLAKRDQLRLLTALGILMLQPNYPVLRLVEFQWAIVPKKYASRQTLIL